MPTPGAQRKRDHDARQRKVGRKPKTYWLKETEHAKLKETLAAMRPAFGVDALASCDFFDRKGRQLREFDVIKVFHFIGARGKHHMYKWLRYNAKGELCMKHLDGEDTRLVPLVAVTKTVDNRKVWTTAEVVQSTYI